MGNVRHVLGISGGKDSAALAIYMKNTYPELDIEYYTSDTGKELDETYLLIDNLEVFLGKKIIRLNAADNNPFDHFLKLYGGFLPSTNARWCTKKLKLEPFEKFIGTDPVVSYVGIRGDEDREGYISKKSNVQSIFPFRKNIWSEDVISKVLSNSNISRLTSLFNQEFSDFYTISSNKKERMLEIVTTKINPYYSQSTKLNELLDLDVKSFNKLVFSYLKSTNYPLGALDEFAFVNNDDVLVRSDIFGILEESGVGIPEYYKEVEFEINGQKSTYARSRSGCFFCFYQQKIEWVWLYEQHPILFKKAMEYESEGYTWTQEESLAELIRPERIEKIKEEYIKRTNRIKNNQTSPFLLDILAEAEGEGCASCFI